MKKLLCLLISICLIWGLAGCGKKQSQQAQNQNQQDKKELLPPDVKVPSQQGEAFTKATQSINNYLNYQYNKDDLAKITKAKDTGDLYFHAADGKRYVFPDINIFKSWFGEQNLDQFEAQTKEKLYETGLGGNVTLRPGTLMMTETDPKIYYITGNGQMKIFGNLTLLEKLYGKDYKSKIVTIPNFYFTQYENIGSVNNPEDIPEIIANITIDQDKGLK